MMANLYTTCADQIHILEASPTFTMSLGAKELFHTNFLAFILEDQSPNLDPIRVALRKSLGIEFRNGESTSCKVWRENNNLDLVVIPILDDGSRSNQRVLVVEAKLKSTVTVEQLNNYTEKLRKGVVLEESLKIGLDPSWEVGRVLLSTKHKLNLEDTGWQHVEWSELSCALRSACSQIGEASLLELLIRDYSASLEALTTILSKADAYLQASSGWHALNSGIEDFKKIRLQDLIGKYLASHKVKQIAEEISIASDISKNIDSESFYSRQSPGFSFKRNFKNDKGEKLTLGIQTQGGEVRRFIESPKKDGANIENYNSNFLASWLRQDDFVGLNKAKDTLKKFDKERFQYTSKSLKEFKWSDLIKEIKTSLDRISELSQGYGLIPEKK